MLLLSACSTQPVVVEADFGNSVRQMISAQTLDPYAAAHPDTDPVMGMDGEKAGAILRAHRRDIARPPEPPTITNIVNIGGR